MENIKNTAHHGKHKEYCTTWKTSKILHNMKNNKNAAQHGNIKSAAHHGKHQKYCTTWKTSRMLHIMENF